MRRSALARVLVVLLRELAETAVVLTAATLVMSAILYAVSPDPTARATGERSPVDFVTRYTAWASGAVRLDFGESPYTHRSINALVRAAAPRTLGLLLLGLAVSSLAPLFVGWRAVLGSDRLARWAARLVAIVSLVPVYLLAFKLRAGPGGAFLRMDDSTSVLTWILFAATLALLLLLSNGLFCESLGVLTAVLRREAAEPYVRSLLARRVPPARSLLRNSSGELLGAFVGQLPRLVTAVFIIEWAFNIHGIGYEGLRAFDYEGRRDIPVILTMTFLTVLIVRALTIAERVAVRWLNPRLRLET